MRLIAGPCLIESRDHCLKMAESLATIVRDLPVNFIFKASYDKANRTSWNSPRGDTGEYAWCIVNRVVSEFEIPMTCDVHETEHLDWFVDCVTGTFIPQVPALLSRQTDLIKAAAGYGTVNIKKGQFMSARKAKFAVEKAKKANPDCYVMLTERGTTWGDGEDLVVDFRGIPIMKATSGADEVLFDATHSVQSPSSEGGVSGGQREFVEVLARAAITAGADGLFCEVHDDPANALSDGPCQIPLHHFADFLKRMLDLFEWQKGNPCSMLAPKPVAEFWHPSGGGD